MTTARTTPDVRALQSRLAAKQQALDVWKQSAKMYRRLYQNLVWSTWLAREDGRDDEPPFLGARRERKANIAAIIKGK